MNIFIKMIRLFPLMLLFTGCGGGESAGGSTNQPIEPPLSGSPITSGPIVFSVELAAIGVRRISDGEPVELGVGTISSGDLTLGQ